MDTRDFDWDHANEDHILAHGVEPDEAEAAFNDSNRLVRKEPSRTREARWTLVGITGDGRLLAVTFTGRGRATRVVTARDATTPERRVYNRRRRA